MYKEILSALSKSGLVASKNSFDNERLKKARKYFNDERLKEITKDFNELRDRFSKPQIKEIRRNVYDIKNPKNLSTQKIKEIEENLFKLEKRLSNFKKYPYQDNFEHRNIKSIRNSFNGVELNRVALSEIDEDYYMQIRTKNAFNGNYVEYESKGDKDKNLSPEEYLDLIRPYLSNIINNHRSFWISFTKISKRIRRINERKEFLF